MVRSTRFIDVALGELVEEFPRSNRNQYSDIGTKPGTTSGNLASSTGALSTLDRKQRWTLQTLAVGKDFVRQVGSTKTFWFDGYLQARLDFCEARLRPCGQCRHATGESPDFEHDQRCCDRSTVRSFSNYRGSPA